MITLLEHATCHFADATRASAVRTRAWRRGNGHGADATLSPPPR